MANHFKPWDPNNSNVPTTTDFEAETGDSQRQTGFQSNTAASSRWVNGGLRQANLFVAAFMQVLEDAGVNIDSLNFQSSVDDIKTALTTYIQPLYRHSLGIRLKDSIDQTGTTSGEKLYLSADLYSFQRTSMFAGSLLNLANALYAAGYRSKEHYLNCYGYANDSTHAQLICGLYASGTSSSNRRIYAITWYYPNAIVSTDEFLGADYVLNSVFGVVDSDISETIYKVK